MHALLIAISRNEAVLTACERSAMSFELPFRPKNVRIWRCPGVMLFSAETENPIFGEGSFSVFDDSAFAFTGVPLLPDLAGRIGRYNAHELHRWYSDAGRMRFFHDVGSGYAVIHVGPDATVTAQSDICSRYPLFYKEDSEVVMVGTIPEMIDACSQRQRGWSLDGTAALSMAAHGQIWGSETFFPDVHLIPSGHAAVASHGKIHFPQLSDIWMVTGQNHSPSIDDFEEAAQSLKANFRTLGKLYNGTIHVGLSGGKDSRIMAAYAVGAGLGERLCVFTSGFPESPELLIGERVAQALGIPHERRVSKPASLTASTFWDRLRCQVGRYQAQLFPMAGYRESSGSTPAVQVSGFGGELYRRGIASRPVKRSPASIDEVARRWPSYHVKPDAAGIMQPSALEEFRSVMSQWPRDRVSDDYSLDVLPELFFARFRVPLHQGIGANHSAHRLHIDALLNPAIARAHFAIGRFAGETEMTHCALLAHINTTLCGIPFVKNRWDERLEPYFSGVSLATKPFASDHSPQRTRPIPWNFFSEARVLANEILFGQNRSRQIYEKLIDEPRLREHMSKPEVLTGVGIMPQVFAIFGMQMFATGEFERPQDGPDVEPEVSNYVLNPLPDRLPVQTLRQR